MTVNELIRALQRERMLGHGDKQVMVERLGKPGVLYEIDVVDQNDNKKEEIISLLVR